MNLKKLILLILAIFVVGLIWSNVVFAGNVKTGHQWSIDGAEGNIETARIKIHSIVWLPAAADNDLVIHAADGTTVIAMGRAICSAANGEAICTMIWTSDDIPDLIIGIDITTIDGGTVYINLVKK